MPLPISFALNAPDFSAAIELTEIPDPATPFLIAGDINCEFRHAKGRYCYTATRLAFHTDAIMLFDEQLKKAARYTDSIECALRSVGGVFSIRLVCGPKETIVDFAASGAVTTLGVAPILLAGRYSYKQFQEISIWTQEMDRVSNELSYL